MNLLNCIGNTPLIQINTPDDYADVYVKLESFNAGGSIKSRVALEMICDAEKSGLLTPNATIIEATGGNTGLGLAIVSLIKGYKFIAVVPDNYSEKRINLLKIYKAEVILSESKKGNDSHINLKNELLNTHPEYVCLDQFKNESCIKAHYHGTGKEIINQIMPDAFVACVGSSGTFTGIGKRLKKENPNVRLYVAQPKGCDIKKGTAIRHQIQGVSLGIIPPLLDYSLIDEVIDVSYEDTKKQLNNLMFTQALFLGASSGTNISAAIEIAKKLGKGKVVCTVAPDSGDYYIDEFFV